MTELTKTRHANIRVPVEEPTGPLGRFVSWYSRRIYGDVLDVALVLWHHKRALLAMGTLEKQVERFDQLDPQLKNLAVMAAAGRIGCSWCVDFGYYEAHTLGLDTARLRQVPGWRDSADFSPTERLVLEFAEAATETPPTVTDELVAALNEALGVPAVVELAMMVAVENERSRFNSSLGLSSQGFTDRCEIAR
jgi:AhpD family alkylhydroperoxidase